MMPNITGAPLVPGPTSPGVASNPYPPNYNPTPNYVPQIEQPSQTERFAVPTVYPETTAAQVTVLPVVTEPVAVEVANAPNPTAPVEVAAPPLQSNAGETLQAVPTEPTVPVAETAAPPLELPPNPLTPATPTVAPETIPTQEIPATVIPPQTVVMTPGSITSETITQALPTEIIPPSVVQPDQSGLNQSNGPEQTLIVAARPAPEVSESLSGPQTLEPGVATPAILENQQAAPPQAPEAQMSSDLAMTSTQPSTATEQTVVTAPLPSIPEKIVRKDSHTQLIGENSRPLELEALLNTTPEENLAFRLEETLGSNTNV